jgi:hypothetical protein
MEKTNWKKRLQEELRDLRNRLVNIIDSNQLSVLGIKIRLGAMGNSLEDTEKILNYIYQKLTEAKENKDINDFKKWDELLIAVSNLYVLNKINVKDIKQDAETAYYLFCLGNTSGYLDAFQEGTKQSELIEMYFHSKRSEDIQRKRRWIPFHEERKKLLSEIKSIVEKYYETGGTAFHNDVAKWFKAKLEYGDKYKLIPDDIIRKTIAVVAEKYGCKRGVKK